MARTVGAYVDHCGFAVPDKAKAADIMRRLGFSFGSLETDHSFHVMFDNGYLEFMGNTRQLPVFDKEGNQSFFPARSDGGVMAIICLSTDDVDGARPAFIEAGHNVSQIGQSVRWAKHGSRQGYADFRSFRMLGVEPFDEYYFALVQHVTPELIYESRFQHVNDICRINGLVFSCKGDALDAAADAANGLNTLGKRFSAKGRCIGGMTFINEQEYAKTFGSPRKGDRDFDLAAVIFEGGDRRYLKAQADALGLSSEYRDGKLYIDVRADLGCFFVF